MRVVILSVALVLGGSEAGALDSVVEQALEAWRPELTATAELMHDIGVCERWIEKDDVDFYLGEYAASPAGSDDVFREMTQRLYTDMYVEGRRAAEDFDLDAQQCERLLTKSVSDVLEARKARAAAP